MESSLAHQQDAPPSPQSHRWWVAGANLLVIATYSVAIKWPLWGAASAIVVNDVAWAVASLSTGLICLIAAQSLHGRERQAWRLIALGCFLWFAGQCVWNYFELARGQIPAFPHWMQSLYLGYPVLLIAGLLLLPKPPGGSGMTVRRVGNLVLSLCTLGVVLTIAVTEPASQSARSAFSIAATLLHGSLYAAVCVVALYLLWGYRWQAAHWPLLLIIGGSAIHTGAFISDVHSRLAGTYEANNWFINAAWLISFASLACAAYEFAWRTQHQPQQAHTTLLARERWLEATMPALLVLAMVTVTVLNNQWITPRVIYLICGTGLVFAITLGIREAWIQREEQRLLAALSESRDSLLTANEELSKSEQRFRTLNTQLEQHVAARTAELQAAYRELESFSYAVAHDIKAPLRAVNAFGSLLAEEYGAALDAKAHSYIERMRRGSLHMSQLVDDLLAYARIERLELQAQPTETAALIRNCIAEQRDDIAKLGAEIIADIATTTLHVDTAAITQAIRNLLQNALKFSRDAAPPRITICAKQVDDRLQISITDNGIGFDMQYHDQLFALFQRLHRPDQYAGTGIGLAIARKAIERMGGRLWAQSQPNHGATFYIELPLAAAN